MEGTRDVAIIVLASINVIVLLLVAILLLALIFLVRKQIVPLIESFRRSAGTLEGTVNQISEATVSPIAKAAGIVAAASKFKDVFEGKISKKGKRGKQ